MIFTTFILVFFSWVTCCHPLPESGKASSDSIYTPHRTRLLKMPLFPMITFWQHTDMSWPHPIFWFPRVYQFYIEWYMNTSCLFVPPLFCCWKTWILYGNKTCRSQKGTTTDTPLQQDKNKSRERRSSISLVSVARKVNARWSRLEDDQVFGCSVSWLCFRKRTKEEPLLKQQVGSIALRMLFCCVYSSWDPGRRGFCCLHCRKLTYSPLTQMNK